MGVIISINEGCRMKISNRKSAILILSSFLVVNAYSFDLGKILTDAVDKSVNDAIGGATGSVKRQIQDLISTAIPNVNIGAKPDDGKNIDISKGVVVFGYHGCGPFGQAHNFLKRNGVPYQLMEVKKDARAARIARQNGVSGSPTIYVNGERIVGYSSNSYTALLKKHGKMK
jgi:glutaredoxin